MTTIIITDDDPHMAEMTADFCTVLGYKSRAYTSSIEALEECDWGLAEILLTDIRMPDMDGLELIERVRQINPSIGIIITTAMLGPAERKLLARDPSVKLLRKPFTLNDLSVTITTLVSART